MLLDERSKELFFRFGLASFENHLVNFLSPGHKIYKLFFHLIEGTYCHFLALRLQTSF